MLTLYDAVFLNLSWNEEHQKFFRLLAEHLNNQKACKRASERAGVRASVRACERACGRAGVRASVCACVRAYVRAYERACVRACVRACERACERVGERASVRTVPSCNRSGQLSPRSDSLDSLLAQKQVSEPRSASV